MIDWTATNELSAALHRERAQNPRCNEYIRVSSISECRRKIAYRLLAYKDGAADLPLPSHLLTVFDIGTGVHLQWQHRLSNKGIGWIDCDPVVSEWGSFSWEGNCEIDLINHEYRLAGHCDGLTRPLKRVKRQIAGQEIEVLEVTDDEDPEGRRYLLDLKTITTRDRYKVDEDPQSGKVRGLEIKPSGFEKLIDRPKDEHINQASIYAWMTTQPDFKADRLPGPLAKIPDVMIIYVGKDLDPEFYAKHPEQYADPNNLLNCPLKVFTQPVNMDQVNTLLKKTAGIWEKLAAGQLPPKDYYHRPDRPAWACVGCDFRQECYKDKGFFADEQTTVPALVQHYLAQLSEADRREK